MDKEVEQGIQNPRVHEIQPLPLEETVLAPIVDERGCVDEGAVRDLFFHPLGRSSLETALSQMASRPVIEWIRENCQDVNFGIRGVVSSKEEVDLAPNNRPVASLERILDQGGEFPEGGKVNVGLLSKETDGLNPRVVQYLTRYWVNAVREADQSQLEKLQPTILVYDLDKLEKGEGNYTRILPEDEEKRQECIIAALPIDVSCLIDSFLTK